MPRVLLVDDEMRNNRTLELGLGVEGVDVSYAVDAADALHILACEEVDLAVIDLMMAGTTGLELARLIKASFPRVRTVLTSTYHLSQRQIERADCGVIGFVPKPYQVGDLVDFLRSKASGYPSVRVLPAALA